MKCEQVDWQDFQKEHDEACPAPAPASAKLRELAAKDVEMVRWYVARAPRRRASPSIPAELLVMAMLPNKCKKKPKFGLGADVSKHDVSCLFRALREAFFKF